MRGEREDRVDMHQQMKNRNERGYEAKEKSKDVYMGDVDLCSSPSMELISSID